jgi:dienelactone hydrolase
VPVAAGCPATGPRDGSDELFVAGGDLVKTVEGAELFLYPGDQHLFTDNSLPAYEESAATLLMQRVLSFLGSVA